MNTVPKHERLRRESEQAKHAYRRYNRALREHVRHAFR